MEKIMKKERSVKNLEQIYGASQKVLEYQRDKELIDKREQTKTELKALLSKYIAKPEHNTICSQRVALA